MTDWLFNFRDDPAALRAWLDRKPELRLRFAPHCDALGIEPSWRDFTTGCACVPVPVADGTFGWVVRRCDACQSVSNPANAVECAKEDTG